MDWSPLVELIGKHQRFVLSSHVRPDADAIGSELGLAAALESLGKDVRIVNPSHGAPNLGFLDPERRVAKIGETLTDAQALDTDVHIIVDTSAWGQLQDVGAVFHRTSAKKVVIDHHFSSDNLGALEFKDTTAAATGELIVELTEALGCSISAKAATPLYCAIATDTGWFRFPSTTARTMRIAGKLVEAGAEPHVLYRLLYEQQSVARTRLFGRVLSRIALSDGGKVAYLWVSQRDLRESGAVAADTEDLCNECLRIGGVRAAFIAIEQMNHNVKVSVRSRLGVNVAAVAEAFGGGGHKQAAGVVMQGSLSDALARVLPQMIRAVANAEF